MSMADSQAEGLHSAGRGLYLLDVEGTVAPLTLTTDVLFPYARKHLAEFLKLNLRQPDIQDDLKLLAEENRAEPSEDSPTFGVEIRNELYARAYLMWLMDHDRKSTALKSLQGKIWKAGFESGELKGTLFDDVPEAFARWAAMGKVAIYSSGSVEAQKLLFGHSNYGDLTPMIAGYFDTRTGAKGDAASYVAIAKAMEVELADTMFFSDVVRELDAARDAGFATRLVVREGNAAVEDAHGHVSVQSFDGI
jgi:enolase-phosphatase E1